MIRRARSLYGTVTYLYETGRHADSLDCLYDNLDEMLLEGMFEEARVFGTILEREGANLPRAIHLSTYAITKPWRVHLQWAGVVRCWYNVGQVIGCSTMPDFMGLNAAEMVAEALRWEDSARDIADVIEEARKEYA